MARVQKVFISYRREDAADVAGRIRDWLVQNWHIPRDNVFMDVTTILPGADFAQVIDQAIAQCQAMIVVMSPSWKAHVNAPGNSFPRLEAETALRRNLLVIPVLVGGMPIPTAEQLPESLRPLLRRNIRPLRADSFDYDMEWVRRALGVKKVARVSAITAITALLLVSLSLGMLSQVPQGNPVYRAFHQPASTAPASGPTATPSPPPLAPQSVVFFGSTDHHIYAINAADCTLRWKFPVGSHASANPLIVGNVMYMASFDHDVYAIDIRNGSLLWKYQASGRIIDSPAIGNGLVFAGADGGILYALHASDGSLAWTFHAKGSLDGSPAVLGKSVYIGADGGLYAIDMSTGRQQWVFASAGAAYSPLVSNGTIYVGAGDMALHAVDPATGNELWRFQAGGLIVAAPTVRLDFPYLFFGALDGSVYALKASDHTLLWQFLTQAPIYASPLVVDDTLYVGSLDHNLYAIDFLAGTERWHFTANGLVQATPAYANGIVYITSVDGSLYALRDNLTSAARVCSYQTDSGIYSSPALNA